MGLWKTKKLMLNKGNHQQKGKGNLLNGRKYLQTTYLIRGWYPKYTKKLIQVKSETNNPIKYGQKTWIDVFQSRHTNGQ